MAKEKPASNQHLLDEAKAALKQAENRWRRVSNAHRRLFRERMDTRGPETEAEQEAKRADVAAAAALQGAREHLHFVQSTAPAAKVKRARELDEGEEGWEEEPA